MGILVNNVNEAMKWVLLESVWKYEHEDIWVEWDICGNGKSKY